MAFLTKQKPVPDQTSLYADRVRVYPKSVHGPVRRFKWAVLVFCLAFYYIVPWIRWNRGPGRPSQAILLDISAERFWFFNLEFWPQDIYYLTGLLIMAAVSLFLVTSLFGRLWCGYTCPQTVWTDLFMWVERMIEGDRNERMKRDAGPANFDKIWRKAVKHTAWMGVAFWTGGAWIMYYADAPTVTREFWTGRAASEVYVFTFLFTATTFLLAGWAREQVCTYMCPWPRFQSAMLDEQSFTTTYQAWRGEPRTRGKHTDWTGGDCVDCAACVTACPTGIDIRDGIQLECINCGLCIDACNHVMARIGRPKDLITWDTLADQAAKAAGTHVPVKIIRPRTLMYLSALLIITAIMGTALALRPGIGLSVLHDRAPLFVMLADGQIRNAYTVKIINKAPAAASFAIAVSGLTDATLKDVDRTDAPTASIVLTVPGDDISTFRITVSGRPSGLKDGSLPVDFSMRDTITGETTIYHSVFMGPAGAK